MAEAAVDSIVAKYFCHECSTSIDIAPNITDLICPKCNSSFIEELTQELEGSNIPVTNELNPQDYIASLFTELSMVPRFRRRNSSINDSSDEENELGIRRNNLFRRGRPDTPTLEQRLPRFLETFFSSIGSNEPNWLSNILNSNLDDYVWDENGLDNIVTELLNQMDGPSPPPASDAAIESLENFLVDATFLEKASQCSICMELFNLEDKVKKLPCIHVFHVNCILPWLRLHGTCPICRQIINSSPLTDDKPSQVSQSNNNPLTNFNFIEDQYIENELTNDFNYSLNFRSDDEGGEQWQSASTQPQQVYNNYRKRNSDKNNSEKEVIDVEDEGEEET